MTVIQNNILKQIAEKGFYESSEPDGLVAFDYTQMRMFLLNNDLVLERRITIRKGGKNEKRII